MHLHFSVFGCGLRIAVCVLQFAYRVPHYLSVLQLLSCGFVVHFAVCVLWIEFLLLGLRFAAGIRLDLSLQLVLCGWRFAINVLRKAFDVGS